jgi:hypothetical protein
MADPENIPLPLPIRHADWSKSEQDLWIEMMADFCGILLGISPEDEDWERAGRITRDKQTREEECVDKVRLAARLADTAMQEVHYRFLKQPKPRAKSPKNRPGAGAEYDRPARQTRGRWR